MRKLRRETAALAAVLVIAPSIAGCLGEKEEEGPKPKNTLAAPLDSALAALGYSPEDFKLYPAEVTDPKEKLYADWRVPCKKGGETLRIWLAKDGSWYFSLTPEHSRSFGIAVEGVFGKAGEVVIDSKKVEEDGKVLDKAEARKRIGKIYPNFLTECPE